ncbi:hypothetical protein F5051DRAFT_447883 [Lentinula edodes]|nr:hypothetical protein F5051DRAFT_447883 [Lentinula edodes]
MRVLFALVVLLTFDVGSSVCCCLGALAVLPSDIVAVSGSSCCGVVLVLLSAVVKGLAISRVGSGSVGSLSTSSPVVVYDVIILPQMSHHGIPPLS